MPLATAKFHITQHTKKRNHWTQDKLGVPGACVSTTKGRFQLEFPDTWNSRLPGLFWGRQEARRAGGDTTRPGRCFKVQLWWGQLFTRMILRTQAYSQTSEQLGWLRTAGEESLLRWPSCSGSKALGGWEFPATSVPPFLLKGGLVPDRKKKKKKNTSTKHSKDKLGI